MNDTTAAPATTRLGAIDETSTRVDNLNDQLEGLRGDLNEVIIRIDEAIDGITGAAEPVAEENTTSEDDAGIPKREGSIGQLNSSLDVTAGIHEGLRRSQVALRVVHARIQQL